MVSDSLLKIVRRATGRSPAPAADTTGIRPRNKFPPVTPPFAGLAPLNGQTLLFPDAQIGIIWSPKSACTKVVLWYFKMIGLLDAAHFYHWWPHYFRMQVLYPSQQYAKWMRTSDWKNFTWYQFARDPVKRLLSGFRHNMFYGYADARISTALKRGVSFREGYSLNDFLDYVEVQNLTGDADPHIKLQWQRISNTVDTNIINIDEVDMLAHMNAIERKHGLPITDFASLSAFHTDDRRRAQFSDPGAFSPARVLNEKDAKGAWPAEASALDPATTERIKRLYAKDMSFICGDPDPTAANDIGIYRKAIGPGNRD